MAQIQCPMMKRGERRTSGCGLRAAGFIIFLLSSALYFGTRSPVLDEWDSVQFALGATHGFNLFTHQPHPPGYPLYVFAGWIGTRLGLDVRTALEAASALGGGLFVAAWFGLARRETGNARLAGWFALALTVLPITWMTATKALSDAPAAGFLALELLGASFYRERRTMGTLAWTALAGAAAAGVRPQNVAVAGLILGLAIVAGGGGAAPGTRGHRWAAGFGVFLGGCLVWLLPTMLLQARWPEAGGSVWAYPAQLWHQWTWRLDQPKAFVGATGQTGEALTRRVWLHFGGLFTRGFAFSGNLLVGTATFVVLAYGWWLAARDRVTGSGAFLRKHRVWAVVYVLIIFTCLPPDQRYYLPIFPLLLLPALAGLATRAGRDLLLPLLPAAFLALALPLAWRGHREPAPPVRLVSWLNARHPDPAERPRVWLIFQDTRRHAQWYGPGFRVEWSQYFPLPPGWPADWSTAAAIYTDDPRVVASPPPAPGGTWRPVGEWHRSPLIYRKHNAVTLWRWSAADGVGPG